MISFYTTVPGPYSTKKTCQTKNGGFVWLEIPVSVERMISFYTRAWFIAQKLVKQNMWFCLTGHQRIQLTRMKEIVCFTTNSEDASKRRW